MTRNIRFNNINFFRLFNAFLHFVFFFIIMILCFNYLIENDLQMLFILSIALSYFSLMSFKIYLKSVDFIEVKDETLSFGSLFFRTIDLKRVKKIMINEVSDDFVEIQFALKKETVKIPVDLKDYNKDDEYIDLIEYFYENFNVEKIEHANKEK